jgi:HJR/Mrr/RecB family endonuclease
VEDYLRQVSIIVLEDSTVGASQKGAAFKSNTTMRSKYVSLITDQHSSESSLLRTSSSTITRDSYAQSGITGLPFVSELRSQARPKIKPTRPPSEKATLKAKSDFELVSKAVLAVKGEANADRPIA